jgi:hypothetical protein
MYRVGWVGAESRSDRAQGGIGAEPAIANRPVIAKSGVAPAIEPTHYFFTKVKLHGRNSLRLPVP